MTDLEKREAVIAEVILTGVPCYPSGYRNKEGCLRCKKGPCPGPIEKWREPQRERCTCAALGKRNIPHARNCPERLP